MAFKVQQWLVDYAKANSENTELKEKFDQFPDDKLVRLIFSSFRGSENPKGLRLTKFGLTVMNTFFNGAEIIITPPDTLKNKHLIYLDNKCKMPYYCDKEKFVVFDQKFAVMLKLAGGTLDLVMDMYP